MNTIPHPSEALDGARIFQLPSEPEELKPAEADKCASISRTPLINRQHVREFLLEHARLTRTHKFTRVSEAALIEANAILRSHLINRIRHLPSKGQTI